MHNKDQREMVDLKMLHIRRKIGTKVYTTSSTNECLLLILMIKTVILIVDMVGDTAWTKLIRWNHFVIWVGSLLWRGVKCGRNVCCLWDDHQLNASCPIFMLPLSHAVQFCVSCSCRVSYDVVLCPRPHVDPCFMLAWPRRVS